MPAKRAKTAKTAKTHFLTPATPEEGRALLLRSVSEADFQRRVVDLAVRCGWLCWHDTDSRRNKPGLPDWQFTQRGVLIYAELKTEEGMLRPAQRVWGAALTLVAQAAPGVVGYFVWRPRDWNEIERVLTTGRL